MPIPDIDRTPDFRPPTDGDVGTDEDQVRIAKCNKDYEESRDWMESSTGQRERWRKNEALYSNEVSVPTVPGGAEVKINISLAAVETEMAIISDYLPDGDVRPEEENDQVYADMLQKRKDQLTRKCALRQAYIDSVRDAKVYGNGIVHIQPVLTPGQAGEDETESAGDLDRIEVEVVDLFTWFPAPGSTGMDISRHARYQCFATPMHVDMVKILYGIEAAAEGDIDEHKSFQLIEPSDEQAASYALIREWYGLDQDREKYPNGRYTIWVGRNLIEDGPIPYSRIPYFMVANYKSRHALFGFALPHLIKSPLKVLNHVLSSIADQINKTGNPVRKIRRTLAAQMEKKIRGVAGEEIIVDNPDDVSWEPPAPMAEYIFGFVEMLLRLIDVVTGVYDVMQGRKPSGTQASGVAIAALQEAAQARVRFFVANDLSVFVKESSEFIIELIQMYDTQARSIRNELQDGSYEYTKYDPATPFDASGRTPQDEGFNEATARTLADSKFEIEVVSGSRKPTGRIADEERASLLFEKGIYGIEQVVNALAEPDKAAIIDGYNMRNGIETLKGRMEELQKAYGEFKGEVQGILSNPNQWLAEVELEIPERVLQENKLLQLIQQYPEFLNSEEFKVIPNEIKDRMLTVFTAVEAKMPAEPEEEPQEKVA